MLDMSDPMPMHYTRWDTASVERARRFDYYRSALCESFAHLTPHRAADEGHFFGVVEHWSGSAGEFTCVATSAHCVSRSRSDISKAEDDHLYLNFIQRGEMKFEQFGAQRILRPGDFVIIDNANLFEAKMDAGGGHRHVAFRMDRQRLPGSAAEITQRLINHDLTPVLRQTLGYLCRANEEWTVDHLEGIVATVRNLTSTILSGRPTSNSRRAAILQQVRDLIVARMSDPEFSLDEVARSLRMSRRAVQKELQTFHLNFSAMLLQARLDQAHRTLLRSSGRRLCMEEVCFGCGFSELSTFYRAFKSRFGVPPAAYRDRLFRT
jgi:AraC family transcriptional regulator, positive regulator of tynA and feaB